MRPNVIRPHVIRPYILQSVLYPRVLRPYSDQRTQLLQSCFANAFYQNQVVYGSKRTVLVAVIDYSLCQDRPDTWQCFQPLAVGRVDVYQAVV
jgi:hypothetical protein